MTEEVTRYIKREAERELWARAAGHCEFDGCNRILFKSPITQESVNIAEKAHIYSFSKGGPRGRGPLAKNTKQLNEIANLLLVCHDCHTKIDQDKKGERYSAELLLKWKDEHEKRIAIVTGIDPTKKSYVVLYGANIGAQTSKLQPHAAANALFPDWYPAEERPIELSMTWEGKDGDPSYWSTEERNLRHAFERRMLPVIDDPNCSHLSLFALAPIPLMVLFGSLLTDKVAAQTYQLQREPRQTWTWPSSSEDIDFKVNRPASTESNPVLLLSLSDRIAAKRITDVIDGNPSIWELTIDAPHNDFLKSPMQLSRFREVMRKLIVEIGVAHGKSAPISIFPAIPVACAVDLGRIRMPKADSSWIIYDQNNERGQFVRALEIK